MLRLVFVFFCSIGFCSNTITYAGMGFECDAGCGNPWNDSNLRNIDFAFQECLNKTINWNFEIYDYEYRPLKPWDGDHCYYEAFDWRSERAKKNVNIERYDLFQNAMQIFYEDLDFYHRQRISCFSKKINEEQSNIQVMDQLRSEGYHQVPDWKDDDDNQIYYYAEWDTDSAIRYAQKHITTLNGLIEEEHNRFAQQQTIAENTFQKIDALFKRMFIWCLENHQPEGLAFHSALENFIVGDLDTALEQIRFLINLSEKRGMGDQLLAKLYLLQGQVQAEFCLYADAIVTLTTAIQKEPSSQEAYFERAAAYFELGQFDQALADYLNTNLLQESRLQWRNIPQLSAGISAGILEGTQISLTEFIPNTLGTLRGLSQGLWAFCSNPVGASQQFVTAVTQCVEYLKNNTATDIVQQMVPELRELIQHYDTIGEFQKGKLIGQVIGQYGIDIFLSQHAATMAKHYNDLKRANQLMTLEALSSPENTQRLLTEASKRWAAREQVLSKGNLKIQWDKQGKHIVGHKNYKPKENKSILTHADPQKLVNEFAGTGEKIGQDFPGTAGYREIVNFQEHIGFVVDRSNGKRVPTTWGKIHYANDDVHIVPTKPRD